MTPRGTVAIHVGQRAPVAAWALALAAVVLAVATSASVPSQVPVLRGLPQVVAWASVALLAGGLLAGAVRLAPLSSVAPTLAAAAALVDGGGSIGAEAIVLGGTGWLCLELTCSSLESRGPHRLPLATVRRRVADVVLILTGGAGVGLAALTTSTGVDADRVHLRSAAALAAVALLVLVAWAARRVLVGVEGERDAPSHEAGRAHL